MDKNQKIRKRESYHTFSMLVTRYNMNITQLKAVYDLLDSHNAYGSIRNSNYAYESLNLVIADIQQNLLA